MKKNQPSKTKRTRKAKASDSIFKRWKITQRSLSEPEADALLKRWRAASPKPAPIMDDARELFVRRVRGADWGGVTGSTFNADPWQLKFMGAANPLADRRFFFWSTPRGRDSWTSRIYAAQAPNSQVPPVPGAQREIDPIAKLARQYGAQVVDEVGPSTGNEASVTGDVGRPPCDGWRACTARACEDYRAKVACAERARAENAERLQRTQAGLASDAELRKQLERRVERAAARTILGRDNVAPGWSFVSADAAIRAAGWLALRTAGLRLVPNADGSVQVLDED